MEDNNFRTLKKVVTNGTVLILSCCLGFGSYFCYDSPAALQPEIKEALNLTQSQFMSLYAWYSWPNVFICFIGGYLIDVLLGRRLGGIFFAFLVLMGQFFLAFGVKKQSLFLMCIGRLIFGAGGETLAVVGNAYSVKWFSGSMLNLAFGLVLSVSRLGATASLNVLAPVYHYFEKKYADMAETEILFLTLMLAGCACLLSLIVGSLLAIIDRLVLGKEESADDEEPLLDPDTPSRPQPPSFNISEMLDFPVGVWMIFLICVAFYSSIFPLISQGVEFFIEWFHVSPQEARKLNSVVYTMALPLSPLFGFIIDRTKKNVLWVLGSILITGSAHGMMAMVPLVGFKVNPWIPTVMMGCGYSMLACSLWPMISFIVNQRRLGTTYGFMQAIQNLGLALTAMISGVIVDKGGYMQLLLFFVTFQILALIGTLVIWKHHGIDCDPIYDDDEFEDLDSHSQEENGRLLDA